MLRIENQQRKNNKIKESIEIYEQNLCTKRTDNEWKKCRLNDNTKLSKGRKNKIRMESVELNTRKQARKS